MQGFEAFTIEDTKDTENTGDTENYPVILRSDATKDPLWVS
jgi:hypothetical protein